MDEAKIAAVVERWRVSGFGITLKDDEYTSEEQVEVLRRCEALMKDTPRRLAERRIFRGEPH